MSRGPDNPAAQVVLVTGASTGVGFALVQALLRQQYRVVATARTRSLLRFEDAGLRQTEDLLILPLDITRTDQQREVIETIRARWGRLDVLVNNAGINVRGVIEDTDVDEAAIQFATNYFGPIQLIREALPLIRQQHRGHIINVSSMSGTMAMPTMGPYAASKFALEGASESLWYELRPWGIHVTLVEPGFIHSNAYSKVRLTHQGQDEFEDVKAPYHAQYRSMGPFIARLMQLARSTPDDIAQRIIRVMRQRNPPLRALVTPDAYLLSLIKRLLPGTLYHRMIYRLLPNVHDWEIHARDH